MKKNESVQNDVHIEIFQNILEDDKLLIDNIIQALENLGNEENTWCKKYKINTIPVGYMLFAKLPTTDVFEISLEDLLYIQSISPSRIENISIGRTTPNSNLIELCIKILNCDQKVMIKSKTVFYSTARKRKFEHL